MTFVVTAVAGETYTRVKRLPAIFGSEGKNRGRVRSGFFGGENWGNDRARLIGLATARDA